MYNGRQPEVIQIKKYPNRRYYDTSNSRHVTLQEMHDLIVSGKDICVTDSRNGDDITNLVLTQILLERDEQVGGDEIHVSRIEPLSDQDNASARVNDFEN